MSASVKDRYLVYCLWGLLVMDHAGEMPCLACLGGKRRDSVEAPLERNRKD